MLCNQLVLHSSCKNVWSINYNFLSIVQDRQADLDEVWRFWIKAGFLIILGVALSAVYVLPFYFDFLSTNAGRVGKVYEWSVANIGVYEMLGNFFLPYFSDVHGAFGGSSFIILALLLPVLRCFKINIPRPVWVIWGIVLFMLFYFLGSLTPIHKLAWKYFPFISSFRHQGRSAIIIPVFLLMLLVWIVRSESFVFRFRRRSVSLRPYSVLALAAALLLPLYLIVHLLFKPYHGELPPIAINKIPEWVILSMIVAGEASLVGLFVCGIKRQTSNMLKIFVLVMAVTQVGMVLRYGTFTEPHKDQSTYDQLSAQKRNKLDYRSLEVSGMENFTVTNQVENSFVEPFLGEIYSQIIPVDSQDDAYNKMKHERLPQQLFIEGYDLNKAGKMTKDAVNMNEGSVKLTYSSFNRLQFHVYSEVPAFMGLSYPYSRHWSASVNGKDVEVYRANGAAHAIQIPEGKSVVEFRYWSNAFFWGMLISCLTFTAIGVFISVSSLRGTVRTVIVVLVLVIGFGGFTLWKNSIYNGDILGTEYIWNYKPQLKSPNLAYGKRTTSTSVLGPGGAFMHYHSSHVIDGDIEQSAVYPFKLSVGSDLIIDLDRVQEIKKIVLYGELMTQPKISFSQDNMQWQQIAFEETADNKDVPRRVIFEKPENTRYIKVEAIDSELGIDELEVYGPESSY